MRVKALAIGLCITMIASAILTMFGAVRPVQADPYPPNTPVGFQGTTYYEWDDFVNVWIGKNNSGLDPYPYADQPPYLGMNYFKTRNICVHSDYSYSEMNNTSLFGDSSTEEYVVLTSTDTSGLTAVADAAKTNVRIRGCLVDDFSVGHVSSANLGLWYHALHHEDANLSQGALKMMLVVYQGNYFHDRATVSWSAYNQHFDGISFWLAPSAYTTEWFDMNGYEDAFQDMKATINNASKTYWLGVYLYWYDTLKGYPDTFATWQLGQALRLISAGEADYINILGSFWILNQPEASALVRNFINNEYAPGYETYCTATTITTTDTDGSTDPAITEWTNEAATYGGYRFRSEHFQKVTFHATVAWSYPVVQEVQSGHHLHEVSNAPVTGDVVFWTEPGKTYPIFNCQYTPVTYTEDTTISTPTTWAKKAVTISGNLIVTSTLTLVNSTVSFNHFAYERSALNTTAPEYKLMIDDSANYAGRLVMYQSMVEAKHRMFFWTMDTCTGNSVFFGGRVSLHNSTVADWAGQWRMTNYSYVHDCSLYMPGMDAGNDYGVFIRGLYLNAFNFTRNLITLPDENGANFFYCPGSSYNATHNFHDNTVIGGQYNLFVDSSYCSAASISMRFEALGTLSDQPAIDYEKLHFESTTGAGLITTVYERLHIRTETGPLTYQIRNADNDLIATVSGDTGETINQTILECVGSYTGTISWSNVWPLHIVVSVTGIITMHDVQDRSGAFSEATLVPPSFGSPDFNTENGTSLVLVHIHFTELSQSTYDLAWMIVIFMALGLMLTVVIFSVESSRGHRPTVKESIALVILVMIAAIGIGIVASMLGG